MPREYLNGKEFAQTIQTYRVLTKLDSNYEEVSNKLAASFYILASNIYNGFKFKLLDEDDAVQECVTMCFQKLGHFDIERGSGSAFPLFTSVILNHLKQLYRIAKNDIELKAKYQDHICSKLSGHDYQVADKTRKLLAKERNNYSDDQGDV